MVVIILILISFGLWVVNLYKDREFQKKEKEIYIENSRQLRRSDSIGQANLILSQSEITEHLRFNNKSLLDKLEKDGIKVNRLESVISQTLKYRDTTKKEKDISKIIEAIKSGRNSSETFETKDTLNCLGIKGKVEYNNDKLKVIINETTFDNQSDNVVYWQRRQWSFLGIKTRILGKKEFTSKSYSNCGQTQTIKIEKKKD